MKHYRVTIFGSARITQGDPRWALVYSIAKMLAEERIDVVTGGGPGLMEAASAGHHVGRKEKGLQSIGLRIALPFEEKDSFHLDIKQEFKRFSARLDKFMELSNAVIVAPGGIGTMLELFYAWQLVQVKHITEIPIILLGERWRGLLAWLKKELRDEKLMDNEDFRYIYLATTCDEALELIRHFHARWEEGKPQCTDYHKHQNY
ncbi:LOG family protein [Candidatus Woesearchaeota archaeon]|nr:MAG: LOG family protein [Candidatus Woesearchaeota archaeon]